MGVSQSKSQNKNQDSNSKKFNSDEKNIPNNSTNDANNTDNKLSTDNIFNKDIERGGYKSKNDPGYSWHHDTLEGKKVLSSLTDAFYMD